MLSSLYFESSEKHSGKWEISDCGSGSQWNVATVYHIRSPSLSPSHVSSFPPFHPFLPPSLSSSLPPFLTPFLPLPLSPSFLLLSLLLFCPKFYLFEKGGKEEEKKESKWKGLGINLAFAGSFFKCLHLDWTRPGWSQEWGTPSWFPCLGDRDPNNWVVTCCVFKCT